MATQLALYLHLSLYSAILSVLSLSTSYCWIASVRATLKLVVRSYIRTYRYVGKDELIAIQFRTLQSKHVLND